MLTLSPLLHDNDRACGFVILSKNGEILFADAHACLLLELTLKELTGKGHDFIAALGTKSIKTERCPITDASGQLFGTKLILRSEANDSSLEQHEPQAERLHSIIGAHPLMLQLYEMIQLVAETDVTVHICGESGVGKELVAEAVHHLSKRSSKRFVRLNCSTVPGALFESALFGHVKGSFTDAHRDQQGFIEYAQGGTIFLDEIGEVSQDHQVKLLRLLQSREYSRVGETIPRKADIRIITATNKDLTDLMHGGKIREDFYYRINVFPLRTPPLRSRISDVKLLTRHFIAKFNQRFSKSISGVSAEVEKIFMEYEWPGNVRELENALEHAFVVTSTGMICPEHLPDTLFHGKSPKKRDLLENQRSTILAALEKSGGNKAEAARLLHISRVGLWKKLKKLNWSESQGGGTARSRRG